MEEPTQGGNEPQLRRRRVRKRITEFSNVDEDTVRYKKRRKRKKAPQKDLSDVNIAQRKMRFWCAFSFVVIGFFIALGLTFSMAYHNSTTFKNKLVKEIESRSGAVVELNKMKVRRQDASAKTLTIDWSGQSPYLDKLQLSKLSASYAIGGLLGGNWSEVDLDSQKGSLWLSSQDNRELGENVSEVEAKISKGFTGGRCYDLDVFLDEQKWITGTSVRLILKNERTSLSLAGGRLGQKQQCTIERAVIDITDDHLMCDMSLQLDNDGIINVTFELAYEVPNLIGAQLDVKSLSSENLLGHHLAQIIDAEWSGENGELVLYYPEVEKMSYAVSVQSETITLNKLDCFDLLEEILDDSRYAAPKFASGGSIRVERNLDESLNANLASIEETGFMCVKGNLQVEKKSNELTGILQLGVPVSALEILRKNFGSNAFIREERGYLWQNVELSGTVDQPRDDLRSRRLNP